MQLATKPGLDWAVIEPSIYAQCFLHMAINPTESCCKTCQSTAHPQHTADPYAATITPKAALTLAANIFINAGTVRETTQRQAVI